jgi:glutamate synthase domain-containing protein 2
MDVLDTTLFSLADLLSVIFIIAIGLIVLTMAVFYVIDARQSRDAVRRNYPVLGRFRGLFKNLGEFFRHYFFAMDREEMPFNRAERHWITLSSEGRDNTVAFGSSKSLTVPGAVIFTNHPFPTLEAHVTDPPALTIGPHCKNPYVTNSIYNISAMSFGAISKPAVQALSAGAKMAGCWMNTGEGGLSPYHLEGGADIVFQIGTAKYGVRDKDGKLCPDRLAMVAAHQQVKMIELKLSQGAKPGKGGILPGAKVTAEIAAIRGIPEGQDSISPNRHAEASNQAELLDFVAHVRDISGLPVGFKTVISAPDWIADLCREIHKRGVEAAPDFITVDGGDGGTGAAPMPLMDNVGLPLKESLPMLIDTLTQYGLRNRIHVIASGKLVTPAEVAWAYSMGADFVTSARGFMFALGCIQALKCNRNVCPTGITTHDKRLQQGLVPAVKSVRVKNFVSKIRYGTNLIAHASGANHPRAMRRCNCRIVQQGAHSVPLSDLYPEQRVLPEYS